MAEKGVQVNATIPKDWDQAIEDHRWTVRKTKTQVIRTAVEEYMQHHGIMPGGTPAGEHGVQSDETA